MSDCISNMISSGAIVKNTFREGFISHMFTREKPDGSFRPIFNLKSLNLNLEPHNFQLINIYDVPTFLKPNDLMIKIDLSHAYYHIPVISAHQRFLTLSYDKTLYQMTCLPFGLSTAPNTFAKITNWLASYCRDTLNMRIIVYLDDFLLVHQNQSILEEQRDSLLHLLNFLGWCVNTKKSILTPATCLEFLGILWNTLENKKSLPVNKIQDTSRSIQILLKRKRWNWKRAKSLLGKLNFASFAIPQGRLHCRKIQIAEKCLLTKQNSHTVHLTEDVTQELDWWMNNLQKHSKIFQQDPTVFIVTDAADTGWGATINSQHLCGRWNRSQESWHCNRKELWALYEALKSKGPELKNLSVMLQTDNKTAVAYITKQGGTRSQAMLNIAFKIFELAQRFNIQLTARYLPGRYNGIADSLSRFNQLPEWHLKKIDHRRDLQDVRNTRHRSICFQELRGCEHICIRRCSRPGSPIHRCLQQEMEFQPRLRIPTTRAYSTSLTPPGPVHRDLPSRSPQLGENVLEPSAKRKIHNSSYDDTQPRKSPNRLKDKATTASSSNATIAGLANTGWSNLLKDWSQHNISLLESAWRDSTKKTYKHAWSRWENWCHYNQLPIQEPPINQIAQYLCHLYQEEKLAFRTILVHKSVIVNFAKPLQTEAVNNHPLIKQILKGIQNKSEAARPRQLTTWCVNDLIEYLKNYTFKEDSLFQVARHVATLLLLASGRRVHDLTLLEINHPSFKDEGSSLVLWPRFGSKTDSSTHQQSGWKLMSNPDSKLDLVVWIRKLIQISKPRRESKSNLHHLFITTRGKVKGASRTVIAGWIRTLFKEAGINASSGSFRAAVTSDILNHNHESIDDVLKRGNWKSKKTVFNHYFKCIEPKSRHDITRNPMLQCFSTK